VEREEESIPIDGDDEYGGSLEYGGDCGQGVLMKREKRDQTK